MGSASLRIEEVGVGREAEDNVHIRQASVPITNLEHGADHITFELPSETRGRHLQVKLSWVPPETDDKQGRLLHPADASGDNLNDVMAQSPRQPLRSVLDGMRSPNVSDRPSDRRTRVESLNSSLSSDLRSVPHRERKPQNWYMDVPPPLPPLAPMPVAASILTMPSAVPLQPVVPLIPVHYTHWGFPPTPPTSPFVPVDIAQAYAYAPVPGQQYLVPSMVDGTGLSRRPSLSRVNEAQRAEYEREKAERRRQRSERRDKRERREGMQSPLRPSEAGTVKAKSAGQAGGKTEGKRVSSGRR
ncbi:uncharacterized protein LOC62_02G002787 [Vanrija pseudolonga]|uniref:Uncharacterized protein n=1 Tax=Vanrija pseudolonga TaxID=143232 RepID=A0AAF1BK67_9TREE|nr:hypothetical protein LOC62_02G002787 [Vanrija pseudolonga]